MRPGNDAILDYRPNQAPAGRDTRKQTKRKLTLKQGCNKQHNLTSHSQRDSCQTRKSTKNSNTKSGSNTKKVSDHDQEIPQSHTAGQPKALWGRATEQ